MPSPSLEIRIAPHRASSIWIILASAVDIMPPLDDGHPFRLLDLPPEIWLLICKYALDPSLSPLCSDIVYKNQPAPRLYLTTEPITYYPILLPALTRVNRILRTETLKLFHRLHHTSNFDHVVNQEFVDWSSPRSRECVRKCGHAKADLGMRNEERVVAAVCLASGWSEANLKMHLHAAGLEAWRVVRPFGRRMSSGGRVFTLSMSAAPPA